MQPLLRNFPKIEVGPSDIALNDSLSLNQNNRSYSGPLAIESQFRPAEMVSKAPEAVESKDDSYNTSTPVWPYNQNVVLPFVNPTFTFYGGPRISKNKPSNREATTRQVEPSLSYELGIMVPFYFAAIQPKLIFAKKKGPQLAPSEQIGFGVGIHLLFNPYSSWLLYDVLISPNFLYEENSQKKQNASDFLPNLDVGIFFNFNFLEFASFFGLGIMTRIPLNQQVMKNDGVEILFGARLNIVPLLYEFGWG